MMNVVRGGNSSRVEKQFYILEALPERGFPADKLGAGFIRLRRGGACCVLSESESVTCARF